jgi:hypothetical protein
MRRIMTAPTPGVHANGQTEPAPRGAQPEGGRVADEHVITLAIEASGEVTPAPTTEQAGTNEAEPRDDEEGMTDG